MSHLMYIPNLECNYPKNRLDFQVINPIDFPQWNHIISSFENASCFHTSNWASAICDSYGYIPSYIILNNHTGMAAVLPLLSIKSTITRQRGVSLPFTDFCDPLISDLACFEDIFSVMLDYGKKSKWRYIELRGCQKYLPEAVPSNQFYTHRILLDSNIQKLMSGFRNSTLRNIKKAQKLGVKVQIRSSLEYINYFYDLNCKTRRQHGLPPQPYTFFKNLHKHVLSAGFGKTAIAFYQGQPVAGALYLNFDRKAIYKYGASDTRFSSLRSNNLVMWEAIKWYAQRNYEELHMGRTDPSHTGLDQYKSGWSTVKETLYYYKYDIAQQSFVEQNGNARIPTDRFLRNLPIPLLKLLGKLAYRHIG